MYVSVSVFTDGTRLRKKPRRPALSPCPGDPLLCLKPPALGALHICGSIWCVLVCVRSRELYPALVSRTGSLL